MFVSVLITDVLLYSLGDALVVVGNGAAVVTTPPSVLSQFIRSCWFISASKNQMILNPNDNKF